MKDSLWQVEKLVHVALFILFSPTEIDPSELSSISNVRRRWTPLVLRPVGIDNVDLCRHFSESSPCDFHNLTEVKIDRVERLSLSRSPVH